MGTFNGNANGGRFVAAHKEKRKHTGAWKQILVSLALLADLFLLYTVIMQLTHVQKVMELSPTVNYVALGVLSLGALALIWAVIRTQAWKRLVCLVLIFSMLYLICVFSDLPFIKKYRDIWISTAMSTMRHQGLATFYIPASVVDARMEIERKGAESQEGVNSTETHENPAGTWQVEVPTDFTGEIDPNLPSNLSPEQARFYTIFHELDIESAEAYFLEHPSVLANGYDHLLINESELGGTGTSIRTKQGEKVLTIDAPNQILMAEVDCDGSRGVLAVAKQPSRLHLFSAENVPYYGETAGSIAKRNGGVLAMTGSSFDDPGGAGNGGKVAGWAMCDGKTDGTHFAWGYKRLELHEDDWFYITDCYSAVGSGTTDAMEFSPALVVNGKKMDPEYWTSQNPRACIGQSERGEILMLCVEGRTLSSPGCSVSICSDVLLEHDCITALNCDGGTTAILWYRGNPIIRCSNSAIPQGRYLPNAWVYVGD